MEYRKTRMRVDEFFQVGSGSKTEKAMLLALGINCREFSAASLAADTDLPGGAIFYLTTTGPGSKDPMRAAAEEQGLDFEIWQRARQGESAIAHVWNSKGEEHVLFGLLSCLRTGRPPINQPGLAVKRRRAKR